MVASRSRKKKSFRRSKNSGNPLIYGFWIVVIIISAFTYQSNNGSDTTNNTTAATDSGSQTSVSVSPSTSPSGSTIVEETENVNNSSVTVALNSLTVTDEKNDSTYDRDEFKHWVTQSNGCNTRSNVLEAESTVAVTMNDCTVKTGSWYSAYDGKTFTNASDLDIDHLVPLAEAWRSGAYGWTDSERESYANDIADDYALIAVSTSSNRSKSDQDPSDWLPMSSYQCEYVASWVAVKVKWNLTVDTAEKTAIENVLSTCADDLKIPE